MLKKLFVAAAAAAVVSVPLAGVAWADPPSDPGSNGNGIGKGGVPQKAGTFANSFGPDATGALPARSGKAPPGSAFKQAAKLPGNTPDAYGDFLKALLTLPWVCNT